MSRSGVFTIPAFATAGRIACAAAASSTPRRVSKTGTPGKTMWNRSSRIGRGSTDRCPQPAPDTADRGPPLQPFAQRLVPHKQAAAQTARREVLVNPHRAIGPLLLVRLVPDCQVEDPDALTDAPVDQAFVQQPAARVAQPL